MTQSEILRRAAQLIGDMRFIQASSIVSMRLEAKAYRAAKVYMNELEEIQKHLDDMALETLK